MMQKTQALEGERHVSESQLCKLCDLRQTLNLSGPPFPSRKMMIKELEIIMASAYPSV